MYSLRKDEVQVLKQMRQENEAAVKQQRELELQRAVERRRTVREHQKAASQRKAAEQSIAMSRLKDTRESRRQELTKTRAGTCKRTRRWRMRSSG